MSPDPSTEPPAPPRSRFAIRVLVLAVVMLVVAALLFAPDRVELCMATEMLLFFVGMGGLLYRMIRDEDAWSAERARYFGRIPADARFGVLELLLCVSSKEREALENAMKGKRTAFELTRGPLVAWVDAGGACSVWLRGRPAERIEGDAVDEAAKAMRAFMARDRAPEGAGGYRGGATLSHRGAGFVVLAVTVVARGVRAHGETKARAEAREALRFGTPDDREGTHAVRWLPESADMAFDEDALVRAFPMLDVPSFPKPTEPTEPSES